MVFSSSIFILLFLPAFLLGYYLAGNRYRNAVAAMASLFFYAWGEPVSCLILIATCCVDYYLAMLIGRSSRLHAKVALGIGCTIGLTILGLFKYLDFFIANVNLAFGMAAPSAGLTLPIGISFYTFQKITYLVDVYRGQARPARSFLDYILYVTLFPQLIAGPIVRYLDVAEQIRYRVHSWVKFKNGMTRFTVGLAKKVLLANELAVVADKAFGADASSLGPAHAWIGLMAYTFQIYFDFSGYSDMAIGLGRMMGFRFPENFRQPYTAENFTEFWRRWHITLSTFMRDYLYIPMGGNRGNRMATIRNMWIVFLLSGFWHGASWNFVVWGAYHGFFLMLATYTKWTDYLPRYLARGTTFLLASLAWVFFRAENLGHAMTYFGALMGLGDGHTAPFETLYELIHFRAWVAMLAALLLSVVDYRDVLHDWSRRQPILLADASWVASSILFVLCFLQIVSSSYNPFIYFRF